MVTCELIGRLGNQLFQIATTIATALRNETNYKIPPRSLDSRIWPTYFTHLPMFGMRDRVSIRYTEPSFAYTPIPFTNNMMLSGYFQSEKYFKDCREEIIKTFGLPWRSNKGVVAIHVRRGDYLRFQDKHPVVTMEYLMGAINYFKALGYQDFRVFSDDIKWCKENLHNVNGLQFMFSEGNNEIQDLQEMSYCEHQIIANSSYSWWGAFLNRNPDKVVITPHEDNWFGISNKHLNVSDLIPKKWIRIKY